MRSNLTISETEALLRQMYVGNVLRVVPYNYPLVFTGFDDGTTQTQVLQISANADLVLFEVMYTVAIDDAIDTAAGSLINILVVDSGSNSQYQNAPVPLNTFATDGGLVRTNNLAYPRRIGGRSTLSVQLTNNYGNDIDYLDMSFSGVLVFMMQ